MACNALTLPFALPVIVWLIICQCYSALLVNLGGAVLGSVVLTMLGLLPCALVYAVGLAGAVNCYKCALVDGEMDVRRRFARGIKKNALKYMLFVFIMWLSSCIAIITPTMYSYMGVSILYGVGTAVAIFQLLVLVPAMCLAMVQCVFYEDKLRHVFANSFKLYFMRAFRMIGVTAISALPFLFCLLFPFGWQIAFWVVYAVIGVSVGITFMLWYGKRYFDAVTCNYEDDVVTLCKDDPVVIGEAAEPQEPATSNQRSLSVEKS